MGRQIADNLRYSGKQFLDARAKIENIADFANGAVVVEDYYPNGFVAFCEEDKAYYQFKEDNEVSEDTGRWRKIGGIVDHAMKLDASGKVPSTLEFTPNEADIHIFQQDALAYNGEEVKVAERAALTQAAIDAGWTVNETGLDGRMVQGYEKNGVIVSLKDVAWVADPTSPSTVINTSGITVAGETVGFENVTVDMVKSWANSGAIKAITLKSTEFETAPEKVMVHTHSKMFDSLGNYTKNYQQITAPWNQITDFTYNEAMARKIIEPKEDGLAAKIVTSLGNKYDMFSKVDEVEINTGWVYDADGGWTKIFPADVELDINSENAVSNSAVVRAINAAGHSAKLVYEKDDKVLTLELFDKEENSLSKVAVALGGDVDVSAPKVEIELPQDLYELTGSEQNVTVNIRVTKTDSEIAKVELLADGNVVATYESPEITGESEVLIKSVPLSATTVLQAKVYDTQSLSNRSENKKVYFVKPCLYNSNGVDEEKMLTKNGEGRFMFNFDVAPAAGGEPVKVGQPTIKIPKELIEEYGSIETILGGRSEHHLYTDYNESFETAEAAGKFIFIDGVLQSVTAPGNYDGITVPAKGVYFLNPEAVGASKYTSHVYKDGVFDITWDGNGEGRLVMIAEDLAFSYQVSNIPLTAEQLVGATYVTSDGTSEVITEGMIEEMEPSEEPGGDDSYITYKLKTPCGLNKYYFATVR